MLQSTPIPLLDLSYLKKVNSTFQIDIIIVIATGVLSSCILIIDENTEQSQS